GYLQVLVTLRPHAQAQETQNRADPTGTVFQLCRLHRKESESVRPAQAFICLFMLTQSLVLMLVTLFSGIDGQVRDAQTHREIPAGEVDVSSSRIPIGRQYADRSGRFRFDNLQPGSYVLSVEFAGYAPVTVEIDVAPPRTSGFVIVELIRRQTQLEERSQ